MYLRAFGYRINYVCLLLDTTPHHDLFKYLNGLKEGEAV
jgi:hypothetical protein